MINSRHENAKKKPTQKNLKKKQQQNNQSSLRLLPKTKKHEMI